MKSGRDDLGQPCYNSQMEATRTKATYYSITPEGGRYAGTSIETHHDGAEAKSGAESGIEPDGEWPEGVEETEWGIMLALEHAVQINFRAPSEDEPSDFDYLCEYKLSPTPFVNIIEAVPGEHRARVAMTMLADIAKWVRDSPVDRVGDAADHLLVLLRQRYPESNSV